jgi:hypothetical protein
MLQKLLLETLNIYSADIILKSDKNKTNQVDLYNNIRALPGVVTLNSINVPSLEEKNTETVEYSYVKIKYIVNKDPKEDFDRLKVIALRGTDNTSRIEGLLQFIIRHQTIKKA